LWLFDLAQMEDAYFVEFLSLPVLFFVNKVAHGSQEHKAVTNISEHDSEQEREGNHGKDSYKTGHISTQKDIRQSENEEANLG